jgi:hypothetical protein
MENWTPCGNKDCLYYSPADCVIETTRYHVWLAMQFERHTHIGHSRVGGTKYMPHPCEFCKHYDPTTLDLYVRKGTKETT